MKDQTCVQDTDLIAQAKDVHIDVIARDGPSGGIAWSLDIKTGGHGNGNKIDLPKDDNYKIIFSLDDKTRLALRFDASGPIFAREGTPAPPCPMNISTQQIMVDSCDAKKLVVIDWNFGAPTDICYQLNFVNDLGIEKYVWDPEIKNGGGGVRPLFR